MSCFLYARNTPRLSISPDAHLSTRTVLEYSLPHDFGSRCYSFRILKPVLIFTVQRTQTYFIFTQLLPVVFLLVTQLLLRRKL